MSEREAKMVRRVTTGHSPAGKAVVISDTVARDPSGFDVAQRAS